MIITLDSSFRSNSSDDSSTSEFVLSRKLLNTFGVELRAFKTRNNVYNVVGASLGIDAGGGVVWGNLRDGCYYGDELVTELNRVAVITTALLTFTYLEPGQKILMTNSIVGGFIHFSDELLSVIDWGQTMPLGGGAYFSNCLKLRTTPTVGIRLFFNDNPYYSASSVFQNDGNFDAMTFQIPFAVERGDWVVMTATADDPQMLSFPQVNIGKIRVELWDHTTNALLDNNNADFSISLDLKN